MEYSRITKSDLEGIIELYEKYLNPGEFIQDTIREIFEEEKFVGFQAKDGEKIVGFFFGKEGVDFTYPHPELEKDIWSIVGTKKLYIYEPHEGESYEEGIDGDRYLFVAGSHHCLPKRHENKKSKYGRERRAK